MLIPKTNLYEVLTNHKYWSRAVFCPTDDYFTILNEIDWGAIMQGLLFKTTEGSHPIYWKECEPIS